MRSRPSALGQGGGGQEADAEVQIAPDLEAPFAERLHPAADVFGDLVPGLRVGAQHRIRVAARWLHAGLAVLEYDVVLAPVLDANSDTRTADVEH